MIVSRLFGAGRSGVAPDVDRTVLLGLFVLALVLRLIPVGWGIGLGQDSGFYHPDEPKFLNSVRGFPLRYFANQNLIYGTALQYIEGLILLPLRAAAYFGWIGYGDLTDRQIVALFVRSAHAVLGAATVLLTYAVGRKVLSRGAALAGAVFLAIAPYPVLNSPLATLDMAMGFLVMAATLVGLGAVARFRVLDFAVWGIVVGLLVSTKLTGALFAVVPLVVAAHALLGPSHPTGADRHRSLRAWVVRLAALGVAAAAVFVISTPHVLLNPEGYLRFMADQRAFWIARVDHGPIAVATVWTEGTVRALGPGLALLAVVGLVVGRARDRVWHRALLAFLLINVLFWRGYLPARFVLPLAPILCLYAGRPVELAVRSARRTVRVSGWALAGVAALVSTVLSAEGLRNRLQDPRAEAARYIALNVPAGATLAFATTTEEDPWARHRWRYPEIDTDAYRVVPQLACPAYLITTSFVMDRMIEALEAPELGENLVWPASAAGEWYRFLVPTPRDFALYRELRDGSGAYRRVMAWSAPTFAPVEFPEPEIRLYERTATPTGACQRSGE